MIFPKKYIQLLFASLITINLSAQICVNTDNPVGVFLIDAQKNNPQQGTISATQQQDDITVTSMGNMGVGTHNTSSRIMIKSASTDAFRLEDNSEQAGRFLYSDGDGYGEWKDPVSIHTTSGYIPASEITNPVLNTATDITHIAYSGMSIELEPGDYQVNFSVWTIPVGNLQNSGFCSVFFSASSTSNIPPTYLSPIKSVIIPRLYNDGSAVPDYYGSGSIPIRMNNKSTIYLWTYMHSANWISSSISRSIRSNNQVAGNYGPYVQLYAIPIEIHN